MPIPLILAGLGAAAGIIGAGGHLSAKETNEKAQRVSQDAKTLYNNAKQSLEQAQAQTEEMLLGLGYRKKNILDSSMKQFLDSYDKVKHIEIKESAGFDEISNFAIDQQGALQLREMTNIYSSAIKSGATGVAAGAVVALAASGSLTLVTGELAIAGSALLAGEVTAAAGIAGSALSLGAAMTPLAAVAAPVVLFTGISASMKADENLEKAHAMYAEAEAASEKMKTSETLCKAIADRSKMFDSLLGDLNRMFAECSGIMAGVIRKKEGRIFKKKLTSNDFTEEELKLMAVTRSLAGAVKAVIATPMLSKDGNISCKADEVYEQTRKKLPDFNKDVVAVKSVSYCARPIQAKAARISGSVPASNAFDGTTVLGGARKVLAFVVGLILAAAFAGPIAESITMRTDKFLFLDAITANKIALWLVICSAITILAGNIKDENVTQIFGCVNAAGLSILYVQFCRTVGKMDHYIIFSVIAVIIMAIIMGFFDNKKHSWPFAQFYSHMCISLVVFPCLFLVYAFGSFIGFSDGFCLVATTILNALFAFAAQMTEG